MRTGHKLAVIVSEPYNAMDVWVTANALHKRGFLSHTRLTSDEDEGIAFARITISDLVYIAGDTYPYNDAVLRQIAFAIGTGKPLEFGNEAHWRQYRAEHAKELDDLSLKMTSVLCRK